LLSPSTLKQAVGTMLSNPGFISHASSQRASKKKGMGFFSSAFLTAPQGRTTHTADFKQVLSKWNLKSPQCLLLPFIMKMALSISYPDIH
jgi:hypothetical protein